jgi:hypothetical protein
MRLEMLILWNRIEALSNYLGVIAGIIVFPAAVFYVFAGSLGSRHPLRAAAWGAAFGVAVIVTFVAWFLLNFHD